MKLSIISPKIANNNKMQDATMTDLLATMRRSFVDKPCVNEKKIGVLISDHNVRDTMNICSKVIVVNKGKIIANGKPDEIAKDSLVKEVYLGQNFLN